MFAPPLHPCHKRPHRRKGERRNETFLLLSSPFLLLISWYGCSGTVNEERGRSPLGDQERIGALLDADGRALTVPGIDDGVVWEREQHVSDRIQQRRQIAARQIRPPD